MQQGEGTERIGPVGSCEFCGCQFRKPSDIMRHRCAAMQEAMGTVPASSKRESDTRCDTAAPSDEAVRAAHARILVPRETIVATLKAAYEIDLPRVRAEERAATLREVDVWLRKNAWRSVRRGTGWHAAADAIAAHFNLEAE